MSCFGTGLNRQRLKVCCRRQAPAGCLCLSFVRWFTRKPIRRRPLRCLPVLDAATAPREPGRSRAKAAAGMGIQYSERSSRPRSRNGLKDGKYAAALDYAQRASQAAPTIRSCGFSWVMRRDWPGKSQLSIDPYTQGLRLSPSSLEGFPDSLKPMPAGRPDDAQRIY